MIDPKVNKESDMKKACIFVQLIVIMLGLSGCKYLNCGEDTEEFTDTTSEVYTSDVDRILINFDGTSDDLTCSHYCRFVSHPSEKIDRIDDCAVTVDLSAYDPNSETDEDVLLGSVTCSGVIGEMCH